MLTSYSKTKRYDDVTKFAEITNEVYGAHSHIPELNELGEYESVNLFHNETKQGLWIIDSLTLKVRYDAVKFENVLNDINLKYFFLKETKEDPWKDLGNKINLDEIELDDNSLPF